MYLTSSNSVDLIAFHNLDVWNVNFLASNFLVHFLKFVFFGNLLTFECHFNLGNAVLGAVLSLTEDLIAVSDMKP